MKKIADLRYLVELSAKRVYSPYFEVAESDSDVYFVKFDNPGVLFE